MKTYRFKDGARKTLAGVLLLSASVAGFVQAQQVTGFEGSTVTPGSVTGDAGIQGTYYTIAPPEGTKQLLLTTINSTSDATTPAYPIGTAGTTTGAVSIGTIQSTINYGSGINNGTATGREGSAFAVSLTLSAGSVVSFSYDFLTQEGAAADGGHNDFAFATLTNASGVSAIGLRILSTAYNVNASGTPTDLSNPYYYQQSGYQTASITVTTAGTYTLGIGVIDANTTDTPSAVLIDNIRVVPVPEPSSIVCLGLLSAVLVGARYGRQKRRASAA